jgi:hypothetical protein
LPKCSNKLQIPNNKTSFPTNSKTNATKQTQTPQTHNRTTTKKGVECNEWQQNFTDKNKTLLKTQPTKQEKTHTQTHSKMDQIPQMLQNGPNSPQCSKMDQILQNAPNAPPNTSVPSRIYLS